MKQHIDSDRLRNDPSYRDGVFAAMAHNLAVDDEILRERTRQSRENWDRIRRERMRGWDSPEWCFYFWRTGWDHISFGFHLCLGGPNIEIHLPFGFLRIGRHTNVKARRDIVATMPAETSDA